MLDLHVDARLAPAEQQLRRCLPYPGVGVPYEALHAQHDGVA
jgi:hypothetical protein